MPSNLDKPLAEQDVRDVSGTHPPLSSVSCIFISDLAVYIELTDALQDELGTAGVGRAATSGALTVTGTTFGLDLCYKR